MSLKPHPSYTVPEETARVARAIYPQGNLYMNWYDTFGPLFDDNDFADLFSHEGQPALSPVRLALVSIVQFVENLPDRQAAEAVKSRIDIKYLLCLELTDPGFDHTVLSEFRKRLIDGSKEQMIFERLLAHFQEHDLLADGVKQRTDSTHVCGAIRALNRIECVGEAMRYALNTLSLVAPDWTLCNTPPDWVERYGTRIEAYRLPKSREKQNAYVQQVGADGLQLLQAIDDPTAPAWLSELEALRTLRVIWIQNYTWVDDGRLRWRNETEMPPASLYINSPYDTQARYNRKRTTSWVGYKVHLTEIYDCDRPHLITNVETTMAATPDGEMTTPIHESLQEKELLPEIHAVDTGYVDAELLIISQKEFGVNLVGPTRSGGRWQEKEKKGFAISDFVINWEKQQAICPAGKTSKSWTPAVDRVKNPVIKIKFSTKDCGKCPFQPQCTKSNRRGLTMRTEEQHKMLQKAREREKTESYKKEYGKRAGIEGTISQGVRRCGMRHSRYRGLVKTHLQHILTACAINIVRVMSWLDGERPGRTRDSAFVRLRMPSAA